MYHVLIVDDEVEIQIFLRNLVQWGKFQMQVIDTVSTGEEALRIAEKRQVDVLITDIGMPGISGLELIRRMLRINAEMKSIILSCHEEFQYAREAIALGVASYLVKYMITREEMEEALKKIYELLQNREKKNPLLFEKLLEDLTEQKYVRKEDIQDCLRKLGGKDMLDVQMAVLFVNDWELVKDTAGIGSWSLLIYAIQNIMDEVLARQGFLRSLVCKDAVVILFERTVEDKQYLKRIFQGALRQLTQILKVSFTIVISTPGQSLENFSKQLQLFRKMRRRYFYEEDSPVVFQDFRPPSGEYLFLQDDALICAMAKQDVVRMEELANCQMELFRRERRPYKAVAGYCDRFLELTENIIRNNGNSEGRLEKKADTFWGYTMLLQRGVSKLKAVVGESGRQSMRPEIHAILAYIRDNIESHITCEKAADKLHMNVSYFSTLFQQEVGMSFSDYLAKCRTEQATFLLQNSSLTIDEITEQIGLSDRHYFHRFYKKQTGAAPGQVRKNKKGK